MKKKVLLCALGLILTLAVSGCGDKTPASTEATASVSTESPAASQGSEEKPAASESAGAAQESEPAETAEETIKPLMVTYNNLYAYFSDESAPDWWGYVDISTPVVMNASEGLQKALKEVAAGYSQNAEWFKKNVDEAVADDWLKEEYSEWSESVFTSIARADDKYLSFWITDDCYLGGAHPSSYSWGYTFDSKSGKELSLENITTDYTRLQAAVIENLEENEDWYFEDWRDSVAAYFDEKSITWALYRDRVSILFNNYAIAPYASGPSWVDLYFEDYGDLFVKDIQPAPTDKRLIKELNIYEYEESGFSYDFDGDGHLEKLTINETAEYYSEDDWYPSNYNVTIGLGKSASDMKYVTLDVMDGISSAYICETKGGKFYLLVDYAEPNDWHSLVTYNLNSPEKGPEEIEYCEFGGLYGAKIVSPDDFIVQNRVHIMGTFETCVEVCLGEDGKIKKYDDSAYKIVPYYFTDYLEGGEEYPYNRYCNTAAMGFAAKEHGTDTRVMIKAGESLYAYETDGETYMTFQRKDGSLVDVYYDGFDEENWCSTINGISEYDIFEEVFYAG